jgi:acetylornithine deacetylase/succinyl-diaminopimelate desuccinylase-like protein
MFGNAARNPIEVLCHALASLRDRDTGRITLPGFYDGVPDLPDTLRAQWKEIGLDDAAILGPFGLSEPGGEKGYTALEQIWARPTCEINGITGGYAGDGFKTVLPAKASAKVSFRLVGTQDPEKIRAEFRARIQAFLPSDCRAEFVAHGGSRASVVPDTLPALQLALGALKDEWGVEAVVTGCGGSIPVVGDMQTILGLQSLLIGFGLDDDRIHSPNEKYDLSSFRKGARSWVRVLQVLGHVTSEGLTETGKKA